MFGRVTLPDGRLRELCDQFEQVVIATLLPASVCSSATVRQELCDRGGGLSSSATSSDLFRQAFAAAIERAGGIGLGRAFARALTRDAS